MKVDRRIGGLFGLCAGLALASGAPAANGAAVPAAESAGGPFPAYEVGARSAALFALQRSGLAAGKEQPVSGEVAGRSYQRYLDSFTQPLPEPSANNGVATPVKSPATTNSGKTSR